MIHIDLNHPIDAMRRQVEVSILTGDGIEYETVSLQQIQWDTVDAEKDTVIVSSEGSEPKVAVYSTIHTVPKLQLRCLYLPITVLISN